MRRARVVALGEAFARALPPVSAGVVDALPWQATPATGRAPELGRGYDGGERIVTVHPAPRADASVACRS